jgi:AAA family ATP:ADP antiporter
MNETDSTHGGAMASRPRRGPLDGLLSIFTDVRGGEGATALLLMLNVFLLLTSYYILKTLREPLILAGGGAEVKSYAAAGQAILLLLLVPAYSAFASRVNRIQLLTWVTLFFALNLVAFWALGVAKTPYIGVAFFIWVGIFSLMIIAQFWSFANDLYTPEQGRRLFAIVAFGSSLGAIVGAWISKPLIAAMGVYTPMLVAAAVLTLSIVLFRIVTAREKAASAGRPPAAREGAPLAGKGAFKLIFSDRYLLLVALLVLVYNFVNTNGEYILGKTLTGIAQQAVAAGQTGGLDPKAYEEKFIGLFYSGYFTWVNFISAALQLFLVGRIMQWFGVRVALFVLPLVALGGYGLLALTPILSVIRTIKIAENSVDYSLQNTARQALFLPTSREAKYKAKAAIDGFFVRFGDVLSAGLVFVGTKLAMAPRQFALVNLVLVAMWIGIVMAIASRHRKLETEAETRVAA